VAHEEPEIEITVLDEETSELMADDVVGEVWVSRGPARPALCARATAARSRWVCPHGLSHCLASEVVIVQLLSQSSKQQSSKLRVCTCVRLH
jgi:hypothetical protein